MVEWVAIMKGGWFNLLGSSQETHTDVNLGSSLERKAHYMSCPASISTARKAVCDGEAQKSLEEVDSLRKKASKHRERSF